MDELGTWAVLLSSAVVIVCAWKLGLNWYYWRGKLPIRSRATLILLCVLAFFSAAGIYQTLADASDAPHTTADGSFSHIHEIYLGHGRHLYLTSIPGVPRLLNLSEDAFRVIGEHQTGRTYHVGYIEDPQEFYEHGKQGFYCEVVDVGDPASGESYYHFDTRHHPIRASVYLADTLVLLLTGGIISRMANARPDTEDDFENWRDERSGGSRAGPELVSMNLGSSGRPDEE